MDAYNANPNSMFKAIYAVNNFNSENKVMILGEMNELGQFSEEEHIKIGKVTKKLKISHLFFVGKKMRSAFKENSNSVWSESTVDLIKKLEKLNFGNSDILIKGSRSLELEKIMDTIKQISV